MIIGYAPGAWDMFHVGHLTLLQNAREHCDHLIVGVVPDHLIELAKGKTPIIETQDRAAIVAAIGIVDEVVVEQSPDKLLTWSQRPFDVFLKGDDWKGTPKGLALEQRFADVGVRVEYLPYTQRTSSTMLRAELQEREAVR